MPVKSNSGKFSNISMNWQCQIRRKPYCYIPSSFTSTRNVSIHARSGYTPPPPDTIEYYPKLLECIAMCLQEPWCDIGNTQLIHPNLESFYPTLSFSKCVTYIRRSSQINAFSSFSVENSFNGIILPIDNFPPFTLYNFYSPGCPKALVVLTKTLISDPLSLILMLIMNGGMEGNRQSILVMILQ
jgi:hypothetical protein